MTGHKEARRSRSSSQRSGRVNRGGGGVRSGGPEAGALFPRLHVKETKTDGPRAPPRNKMALYEQFTFPSHRYVPPSLPLPASGCPAATSTKTTSYGPQATSTKTSPYGSQLSSYEGSMFYGPPIFGGMPRMPYTAMNTGSYPGGQPSFNGSSSSTVLDCEGDFHQRPNVPVTDTARPSSNAAGEGSLRTSTYSNISSGSYKKTQSSDDCRLPTFTSQGAGADRFMWRAWRQRNVDAANTCQPGSVSSDYQVESSSLATLRTSQGAFSRSDGTRDDEGANVEILRKLGKTRQGEEQSELHECAEVQGVKDPPQMQDSYAAQSDSHHHDIQNRRHQHHQNEGLHVEVATGAEGLKTCATVTGESVTVLENDGECDLNQRKTSLKAGRAFKCSQDCESPLTDTVERTNQNGKREGLHTDGQETKKQTNPSECKSSSSAGSHDDMEVASGAEVSEFTRFEAGNDGAESDSSRADPEIPKQSQITSRDIVDFIGEKEFWVTRKLLQRQQKIFSAQVFELHRLIKVQQLLASSTDLLMDEGMLSGYRDKAVEPSKVDEAIEAQNADKDAEARRTEAHRAEAHRTQAHRTHAHRTQAHLTQAQDVESRHVEAVVGDKEAPADTMGKQPDSPCDSSSSYKKSTKPPVVNPQPDLHKAEQVLAIPNAVPGVPTAPWVCPSFTKAGANNWFGVIPPPNGAYMYQPYPGAFHAPPAQPMGGYNGAYRPVVCAPSPIDVSSLPPYGMPRYDQGPDLLQDIYRYNAYWRHQWPPAMFCPPVAANPGASWYGVPSPMPCMDPALRGSYGWYDGMTTGSHPSGPSNHLRPTHQNNAQPLPPTFPVQPPWTDASNGEGDSFQQQVPCAAQTGARSSAGFQRPPTYSSAQDCGEPGSLPAEGVGTLGTGQASAPSFQRPASYTSGQDCEVSGSQQDMDGTNYGWGSSDGNRSHDHDYDPGEVPAGLQNNSAYKPQDKTSTSTRGSRQEGKGVGDTDGTKHAFDRNTKLPYNQKDALPLFPLAPLP